MAEEFHFHLGEFPGAECKVAWIDFIAEGLASLRNAEGQLLPGGDADCVEVHEYGLACLGTEIGRVLLVKHRTHESLHHEVEVPGRRHCLCAAGRACGWVFHLVHAEAFLADRAVRHFIGEVGQVS